MSAPNNIAILGRKRRNSDSKPQSQLNKCENEKRRREQESHHFEELVELLYTSFLKDMTAVKLHKCAILEETVNQIRRIQQSDCVDDNLLSKNCNSETNNRKAEAVQQCDVSSSRPNILANEVLARLVVEALGVFFFLVNAEGKIEYVSDNVFRFLNCNTENLVGSSIYNIIHTEDRNRFSSMLFPLSLGHSNDHIKNKTFTCRLLVRSLSNDIYNMDKYETMQISAIHLPDDVNSVDTGIENQNYLLCVAKRVPSLNKSEIISVEQFTTRLELNGKVTNVDTSGVSSVYSQSLNKDLVGCMIQDLIHPNDISKISCCLQECIQKGLSTSGTFHLRVPNPDRYIRVQSKFKLFSPGLGISEHEFIMATHSIVTHAEVNLMDLPAATLRKERTPKHLDGDDRISLHSINDADEQNKKLLIHEDSASHNFGSVSSFPTFTLNPVGDLIELFPSSSWELTPNEHIIEARNDTVTRHTDALLSQTSNWNAISCVRNATPIYVASRTSGGGTISGVVSRPNSRQSASTPHSSNLSVYSPSSTPTSHISPSPLTVLSQTSPNSVNLNNSFNCTFPFSPYNDGASAHSDHTTEQFSTSQFPETDSVFLEDSTLTGINNESDRLRNLLMTSKKIEDNYKNGNNVIEDSNRNNILKVLLNPEEDRLDRIIKTDTTFTDKSSGNNMLLSLLNKKCDDDDLELKAGIKKGNELLQQLLKDREEIKEENFSSQKNPENNVQTFQFENVQVDPSALQSLKRVQGEINKESHLPQKRQMLSPSSQNVLKASSTTSETGSKLWQKNKMLATLLSRQPIQSASLPIQIPNAKIVSQTPQEKLPKDLNKKLNALNHNWQNRSAVSDQMPLSSQQSLLGKIAVGSNSSQGLQQQSQQQPKGFLNNLLNQPITQEVHNNPNFRTLNQTLSSLGSEQTNSNVNGIMSSLQQVNNVNVNVNLNLNLSQAQNQAHQVTINEFLTGGPLLNDHEPHACDPLLSDILDEVLEIAPTQTSLQDEQSILKHFFDDIITDIPNMQTDMNEKLVITAIQKSLESCENTSSLHNNDYGSPASVTSYNAHVPPVYNQRLSNHQAKAALQASFKATGHLLRLERNKKLQNLHQIQLLQQQQKQQSYVPNSETCQATFQNLDDLLGNSVVPPNVTLERTNSLPDQQLSPSYINNSPSNQQTFGSHSQIPAQNFTINSVPQPSQVSQISSLNQPTWTSSSSMRTALLQQNPMLNAQLSTTFRGNQYSSNGTGIPQNSVTTTSPSQLSHRSASFPVTAYQSQPVRTPKISNMQSQAIGVMAPIKSELVRHELRAHVGARTQQHNISGHYIARGTAGSSPVILASSGQTLSLSELDELGLSFELPLTECPSRVSDINENRDQKKSLLQQLLSE